MNNDGRASFADSGPATHAVRNAYPNARLNVASNRRPTKHVKRTSTIPSLTAMGVTKRS